MSQEDVLPTPTLPLDADPETLVTTYADGLIIDLFDDVDRILAGDEAALAAVEMPPEPPSTAIEPVTVAAVEAVPGAADPGPPHGVLAPLGSEIDFFQAEDVSPAPVPPTKSGWGKAIDRLLLAVTTLALVGVGGLLWFGDRRPWQGASADPVSQSDAEFLAYLQRSLEVISSKVERGELGQGDIAGLPGTTAMSPPPMLPPLGAGGTVGSLGAGPINVIERVYIPYKVAQPSAALPPALAPQVPGVAVPAPAAPAAPAVPAAVPMHSLVGILQLGDRSAALFDVGGVSQRVSVGERIGNSGWSLVSIANEEAVIRRNGEVRSVYIGQRF